MKLERCFITGGRGFIGSHLAEKLRGMGAEVKLFEDDIRNADALARDLASCDPDIVFHCAAHLSKEQTVTDQLFDTNVRGTVHLVRSLMSDRFTKKRPRLVALGSLDECVGSGIAPVTEESREVPISPYGLTKLMGTKAVEYAAAAQGLSAIVVRASLVYGPGQKTTMFMPSCITTLLEGKTFSMSPGKQKRDFIYIDDLVSALISAGEKKEVTGVLHCATGKPVALCDVADTILRIVGKGALDKNAFGTRQGEVMEHAFDAGKAMNVLAWKPQTSLEDGLYKTIQWYRNNKTRT